MPSKARKPSNPKELPGPTPPYDLYGPPVRNKGGRPRKDFDPRIAELVLEEMSKGDRSIRQICEEEEGFPPRGIIFRWVQENRDFARRFYIAREQHLHGFADDVVYLADNARDLDRAKMQISGRQWVASRLLPSVYGDRVAVNQTVQPAAVNADLLMKLTPDERDELRSILTKAMEREARPDEGLVIEGEAG